MVALLLRSFLGWSSDQHPQKVTWTSKRLPAKSLISPLKDGVLRSTGERPRRTQSSSARVFEALRLRRYWLFVLFLDAGWADFFFASPSRPPIRVKASAALNGN